MAVNYDFDDNGVMTGAAPVEQDRRDIFAERDTGSAPGTRLTDLVRTKANPPRGRQRKTARARGEYGRRE